MRIRLPVIVIILSGLLLSACGGGASSSNIADTLGDTLTVAQGITYDEKLASNVDGATIAITIHEPDALPTGEKFPLILHSHGYGGARQKSRPSATAGSAFERMMARMLASGYGILSLNERGHNKNNDGSGGTIRILDPALEGQDWLQTLDWAEANLNWLQFDAGNPVMGAIGGSYGGGYQHLIHAIDNKQRLDAIAPDITWYDLRYSLNPGGNFKSQWATLLSGVGNQPGNTQDVEVNQGLAEGQANQLSAAKQDLLYAHSLRSHCEGNNSLTTTGGLKPIDTFYTQSPLDTLFNFNDAYHNYNCMKALGGDVRIMTKSTGHGLDNGDGGDNCGVNDRSDATFAWYEEKLKGKTGAAANIPEICLNLGPTGSDGIVVPSITRGGTAFPSGGTISVVGKELNSAGASSIDYIDLYTAGPAGDVLAGIPVVDTLNLAEALGSVGVDPILYVALGLRRADDAANPANPIMNQAMSFRGFQTFNDVELVGVFERLDEGDTVVLMLMAAYAPQFAGQGSLNEVADITASVSLPLIGVGHSAPLPVE